MSKFIIALTVTAASLVSAQFAGADEHEAELIEHDEEIRAHEDHAMHHGAEGSGERLV